MRCFAGSAALALALGATGASADWMEGDPHKMHYPQLPDPNGLDVNNTYYVGLADDWQCSESGPVTDLHVWGSWKGDQVGAIEFVHVAIFDNDLTGAYSKPGTELWHRDFLAGEFIVRDWGTGDQGWYDAVTGDYLEDDHQGIYQYNYYIDPGEALVQTEGEVYWLVVSAKLPLGSTEQFGWKTSMSDQFLDTAVWGEVGPPDPGWQPVTYPGTGEAMDLAFVITPEPDALLLLALGMTLLRRKS